MTDTTLDDIAVPHHRIAADEYADICVVGDVHGCRAEFEALVEKYWG